MKSLLNSGCKWPPIISGNYFTRTSYFVYSSSIVLFYRKTFDFVVTAMLPSLRMTQLKISAITFPTCQKALRSDIRARLHCERARGSQLGHYAARQRCWPQWPPAPLGPRHSAVLRWYLSGVISLESTSTSLDGRLTVIVYIQSACHDEYSAGDSATTRQSLARGGGRPSGLRPSQEDNASLPYVAARRVTTTS